MLGEFKVKLDRAAIKAWLKDVTLRVVVVVVVLSAVFGAAVAIDRLIADGVTHEETTECSKVAKELDAEWKFVNGRCYVKNWTVIR